MMRHGRETHVSHWIEQINDKGFSGNYNRSDNCTTMLKRGGPLYLVSPSMNICIHLPLPTTVETVP